MLGDSSTRQAYSAAAPKGAAHDAKATPPVILTVYAARVLPARAIV